MNKPSLRKCLSFASCSLLLVLTACGNSAGTAPTISDLSLTPSEAPVGQQTTLTGKLLIDDPDGDEAEINVDFTLPGGQVQSLPSTPLQGVMGQMSAPVEFVLLLSPPTAGSYEVSVHCTDAAGNASNTLKTTIDAK